MNAARLEQARAGILGVLSGEVTPDSDVGYFEDDTFYYDVYILDRDDHEWLRLHLTDPAFIPERRLAVALQTHSEGRQRLIALLMEEVRLHRALAESLEDHDFH